MRMFRTWRVVAVALAVGALCAAGAEAAAPDEPVTLAALLAELTNTAAVARWPEPAFTCRQASSYDREQVAPDQPGWFANRDCSQFSRAEEHQGRREQVMLDADGPGAIVRFWLTTDKHKRGTLRIYLDGAPGPVLTFPAYDLLAGDLNLAPPLAQPHPGYTPADLGGNTLYLPIPYARHAKVTWEEGAAPAGPRYYQINYRTYAPGTAVQTLTRDAFETARPLIARVGEVLLDPPPFPGDGPGATADSGSRGRSPSTRLPPAGMGGERPREPGTESVSLERALAPGAAAALDLPPGPAAVSALAFRLRADDPARLEHALRAVVVRMHCDGEATIWCPASDFFGSGVGVNALQSWYRTVRTNGVMACRWVMPYRATARLALANLGDQPVQVSLRATVAPWTWDERSMHFHAAWHYEAELATPPHRDWNYIRIAGRGVYVGDNLALFNPVATWYGEGDEKIRVDAEPFPSHQGTGTEDYYNYSFAPRGLMQTPFANQVRVDQKMTQGHNVLTRTRNLDGIPFQRSLQFDIELMSWAPTRLTYAATTYWYAFPGATCNVAPQPDAVARPVPTLAEALAAGAPRKPGALECETMAVRAKSRDFPVEPQDMAPWDRARWSGGVHLLGKAGAVGDAVELDLPAPDAAPRRLVLHATQAPDYGILRFTVNGQPSAAGFDGYADGVQPGPRVDLGVFTPRDGRFTLRAEVAGANPAARGAKFFFGLDCVVLEKP